MDFKKFSELMMIEQTFFALPFALLGVLFAGGGTPIRDCFTTTERAERKGWSYNTETTVKSTLQ